MVLGQLFSKSSSPDKEKAKDRQKNPKSLSSRKKDKDDTRSRNKDRPPSGDRVDDSPRLSDISIPAPDRADSPDDSPQGSLHKSSAASSPRKSPTKPSLSYRDLYHSHSRSSSTASKHSFFSSNRNLPSRDSHPLNLPPDELRRRLSAMAAARDESMRSSMDIDRDTPSSPQETPPASQSDSAPTNSNGVQHGDTERSPTPPPHRSSPPQSQPSDGGESFKLAGNKFYKAGDYERAIEEYNKGQLQSPDINPKKLFSLERHGRMWHPSE